jgi:hypothetical protein
MARATAADVELRWGRVPTDAETTLIETRLDDVERMIYRRLPDLDQWILDGQVDAADVVQVEAEVVLRLVRNPEGYLSETDGNYSYQMQRELASGRLSILPEEWEMLGLRRNGMSILIPEPQVPRGIGYNPDVWRFGIWPEGVRW